MKIKSVIAAIVLFSIVMLAGCKASGDALNKNPTDSKVLDMTAGNVLITEEKMDLQDRILSVLSEADSRLATAETVVMDLSPELSCYWRCDFDRTESAEDSDIVTYYITSDEDRERMQYLLLLYTLTTEYADCLYFIDENYTQAYNRLMITDYFVSDSYEEAGYDTVRDYYLALTAGECEKPDDAIRLDFSTMDIRPYKDWFTSENIWPMLLETAKELNK